MKWIGLNTAEKGTLGGQVKTVLVLSDATTAQHLAIMDASWITGVRTAAVSLLGARRISSARRSTVGILGTGVQARTHLEMFISQWSVQRAVIWGRRRERATILRDFAQSLGCEAEVAESPNALLGECDVVISALGAQTDPSVGLNAGQLRSSAYLSLVDLGRPWIRQSLQRVSIYADDRELTLDLLHQGALPFECELVGDLVTLSGDRGVHSAASGPTGLLHPGVGYADLAVAASVFEKARGAGVGISLPN